MPSTTAVSANPHRYKVWKYDARPTDQAVLRLGAEAKANRKRVIEVMHRVGFTYEGVGNA